ncbi:hypothetical protein JW964_01795 [candidate division KSB1 bacterium]|nr:hypothetical protein [candidate division KSB1 bacterium]
MKANWINGILIILISIVACTDEKPTAIDLPLVVSNDMGAKLELRFGLHPSATDTLDKSLGEQELPPFPPGEIMEARFIGDDISLPQLGLGTYVDYRKGDSDFKGTKTHEIRFQIGSGNEIIFKWDLPDGITGIIQDFVTGEIVKKSMAGSDSLVLSKPLYLDKLMMIIEYGETQSEP